MDIDNYGNVILNSDELFESLYNGKLKDFSGIFLNDQDVVKKINQAISDNADNIPKASFQPELKKSITDFDKENQHNWFMPKEYQDLDIENWIYDQCFYDVQIRRVDEELALFRQHGMIELLQYLKYLVDTMRSNNIVWGVGRGSSVASYVLYLLGIHKIDSIKYGLDIKEFLK